MTDMNISKYRSRYGQYQRSLLLAAISSLTITGTCLADGDKQPTVDECLLGAMATRRAIQSADVEVVPKVDVRDYKTPPAGPQFRSRWVMSGNKILNKSTVPTLGGPPVKQLACRNCQASASQSSWSAHKLEDGGWLPLMVGRLKTAGYKPMIFDPRVLGMNCSMSGTEHASTIDGFRENLTKNVVRSSVATDPDGLLRLTFHYADGQERNVRMSGPPAYRVASYEIILKETDGTRTGQVIAKVESVEVAAPVYWFPKRIEYREEFGGKVAHHEVCDIAVNSVNQPIPSSTFEIANFDLPAGVRVHGLPNSGDKVWDGTALIDESLYTPPPPAVASVAAETARGTRWWTWIAYAALAIGIAAFLRFLVLRRRARTA